MDLLLFVFQCIYLLLPAAFANMAPVFFKRVNFLKYPVDFNMKLAGKPMLGRNKTYRGVFFGIIFSTALVFMQKMLYGIPFFHGASLIDYGETSFLLLGFLLGFGAALGDLTESFVKRRLDMSPGQRLIFLDQTDWVIGSLAMLCFVYVPTIIMALTAMAAFFLLHAISKHIGYYTGLEESRW